MKKPARAMRSEAREIDGTLCFVLIGRDGAGRTVEVAAPAEGLHAVFSAASQQLIAHDNQRQRRMMGEYTSLITQQGEPATVGTLATTEGERVVLIARKGLPTELALSFAPRDARELAQELVKMADQADAEGRRSSRPN